MISKLKSRAGAKPVSRRSFLIAGAAAGGGLAIGVQVPGIGKALAQKVLGAEGNEVGAWVVIRSNDDVIVRIARSEMGQGTLTGLAQLVCEELQCDWKKVKAEYVLPGQSLARNRVWGDMSTGGSRGIRTSHDYVRKGGAAAREMLIKAAADGWKVPVEECTVENGVITHAKSNRKTTYGKVAQAAAKLEVPKEPKIKDPKDWTLIGKGVPRLDTEDKVNGKLTYAIDVKVPGMLLASIMDAPVFGAKLKSVDDAKAKTMPGVKHVLRVGDSAVAVVAETWWQANQALKEVKTTSIRDTGALQKKVQKGLDRLYGYQHEDGGWGWWKDDPTDPFMTAYVVDGLQMARAAGFAVDNYRLNQGRQKIKGLLEANKNEAGKPIDIEDRAYLIYALNASAEEDPRFVLDLFNKRSTLQPYGRALLALALRARGDKGRAEQVEHVPE